MISFYHIISRLSSTFCKFSKKTCILNILLPAKIRFLCKNMTFGFFYLAKLRGAVLLREMYPQRNFFLFLTDVGFCDII